MIENFSAVGNGAQFKCDLCIVGAGAAGLSLLMEFLDLPIDVIVLESGTDHVEDAFDELNDGEVLERPFTGLRAGRRRGFGGTTAAWGGQCCELEEIDFEPRAWVPNSGWPIRQDELRPFYRRAEHIFGVSGEYYDEAIWRRFHIAPSGFDPHRLRSAFSVFSPRPRIGRHYRRKIESATNVRVIIGATASKIVTDETVSYANSVEVRGPSGNHASVHARAFVICAGTIESARLLLASRDRKPHGLGNDFDLVGRFFQDHPTSCTGLIVPSDRHRLEELYGVLYRGKTWYWPKIALAPELQRRFRALNASAFLSFVYASPAIEVLRDAVRSTRTGSALRFSGDQIKSLIRGLPDVADAGVRRYILGRSPRSKPARIELVSTIEQAPNPNSRIFLGTATDRLGMPKVVIDWKLTDAERDTFRLITETIAEQFQHSGLGTIDREPWLNNDDIATWKVWDNYHQTGTTRMSTSPRNGVVDLNGQVHGIDGLFIAGAPTFPTSGFANPVLTISALSLRLADYLKYRYFPEKKRSGLLAGSR